MKGFSLWEKDFPLAKKVRGLAYKTDRAYRTYKTYIEEESAEVAANVVICVIYQTNYLLDQQLRTLDKDFLAKGGFTENLYHSRKRERDKRDFEK